MKNLKIDQHIILDKPETWPTAFNQIMELNSGLIKNYLREEEKIKELYLSARFSRIELNPYKLKFQELIFEMEQILVNHKIMGLHCTRLLDDEIGNLKKEGLKPLSKELAISKINLAFSKGLISTDLKLELLNKEEYQLECRTAMVYFFHCISTLKNEHGLKKLFGYWGGEAIYMYNKDSTALKKIGVPCIVLLSVNIVELNSLYPLSERMIKGYFKNDFESQDSDSKMDKPVPVLEVIEYSDTKFEELTNYSNWEEANKN